MDAFAMKESCSSKASSKSPASEESHEVIINKKKMKENSMEDSQLKTHELSSVRALLDLKFHNDYNNEKNINCSNLELMKEKIVEGYQWKTHELSEAIEEHLSLKVNNCRNNNMNINYPNLGLNLFNITPTHARNNNNDMIGTRVYVLENSLNSESKNSAKGLNLKDSQMNIDDNVCGNCYMQMKFKDGDAEKNNEEEEELDLDLQQ
ncbi:hypothetical protein RDI58_026965 [Solanum bulbocastanum]|uniref:Uncharacterized protein n=1 Tax=Solanum bulbocastanum TaxID=147425 RepID=A0AAN8SV44_SOLBU